MNALDKPDAQSNLKKDEEIFREMKRQQRALRGHRLFLEVRFALIGTYAAAKLALERLLDRQRPDFFARRSRMRHACAAVLFAAAVIGLAVGIESVTCQELAVDVALFLAKIGFGVLSHPAATVMLMGMFMAVLLITKVKTDCHLERAELRTCVPEARSFYSRRIWSRRAGKVAYLICLAAVFWYFNARRVAAVHLLQESMGEVSSTVHASPAEGSPPASLAGGSTSVAKDTSDDNGLEHLGSLVGLYTMDWLLHLLVLFGMEGISLSGISFAMALDSPKRAQDDNLRIRKQLLEQAKTVMDRLKQPDGPEVLADFTEEEKRNLNEIYGKQVVEVAPADGQPQGFPESADQHGQGQPAFAHNGTQANGNSPDGDAPVQASEAVTPF